MDSSMMKEPIDIKRRIPVRNAEKSKIILCKERDHELLGPRVIPTGENGHGALAGILDALGVEVLICGGIGGGAQMALDEIGVKVVGGAAGSVDDAVKAFLAGTLETRGDFSCHHHEHDANHRCGDHGCGEHSCHGHHDK